MHEIPITVTGEGFVGQYVKPGAQAGFVSKTQKALRDATRYRTFRSSRVTGRPFRFLSNIWDIDQAPTQESNQGKTLLVFRAPTLMDAAPKLFEQGALFEEDRLDPNWTVFDLLGQVLGDLLGKPSLDWKLDYGMIDSLHGFSSSFRQGLAHAEFPYSSAGAKTAVIDQPLVDRAGEALQQTPEPRRIRVVGKLDMLRLSDRLFQLIMADGSRIRGLWTPDALPLRDFFGEEILLEGEASFRTNGDLLAVEARAVRPASEQDAAFRRRPVAVNASARLKLVEPNAQGFSDIVGKWPGDESDEEVEDFLRAIS